MQAGGERRFLEPLLNYFQKTALDKIDQAAIDRAATTLYPRATPASRNRQVYTPISAILKHAGCGKPLKRPKGARGESRVAWLQPEQAFELLRAAEKLRPKFGALCTFLLYTGCRLSEALTLAPEDVDLTAGIARVRKTKNGEPRTVYLPPVVLASLANIEFSIKTVFGYPKSGRLYKLLSEAEKASGITIPERVAFHIFRHSWATWMRKYGGLDTSGLVATGAWKSRQAAAVYEHLDATEEAKKAALLPSERSNG
jgi:integrase